MNRAMPQQRRHEYRARAPRWRGLTRALHTIALLGALFVAAVSIAADAHAADDETPAAGNEAPAGALPGTTTEPAQTAATPAPAQKEDRRFDIWEYRVLGSQVLPQRDVERAVYGFLGPQKTIADVEKARQALEAAYRAAGYSTVFVDIPEQTVDTAVVRLNVTEGKIDRLRVSGARYFANRKILAELPALKSGEVPHLPDVQKELTALNRQTPDRTVTPVLRAGRYPGTVDMELKVEDHLPLHGSFEVNDRYTADTTPTRADLTLSYDNLWQRNHTASLQYQVAPEEPHEAKVIAGTYVARLANTHAIIAGYAVDSKSDVATIGTLSVIGKGRIYGVRGIRPLDAIGRYFHNLTLGLDLKDFDENIRLTESNGVQTPIKYVNWSATYGFGWTFPKSTVELSIGADWGLRGFGNDDFEFEQKRYKARANYNYLLGTIEQTRQVFGNAHFVMRASWQYSSMPLISNEQFTAGGAASVRGYLEAERLGDTGASLSLELRSPSLLRGAKNQDLEVLGFFDTASLVIVDPLPDQDARFRLKSAGAGLRFTGLSGLAAELDWARPLVDGANVAKDEDRLHFSVKYSF
jgi:hemolysin activation/secretion protein